MIERSLKSRTTLITGASSGIGKAIAKAFAEAGCNLVLTSRSRKKLTKAVRSLQKYQAKVSTYAFDLALQDELDAFVQAVKREHKRIDVLINNAGIGRFAPIDEVRTDDWDDMLAINLRAPLLLCQAFVPMMKHQGAGKIINISSIAGKVGVAKGSAYAATKFGLEGLNKSLYDELRDYNITITTINPGSVDTPFFDSVTSPWLGRDQMLRPKDVADIALFIATRPQSVLIDSIELRPRSRPSSKTS